MCSRYAKGQQGVTLVELIVTIVVVGIALAAVVFSVQYGTRNSADTLIQVRATALAQAYLDEILGKRYDERSRASGVPPCRASAPPARQCTAEGSFGTDAGETSRNRYDDVDDYHGLREGNGEATPLQDADGNTRAGYDNFTIDIQVRYINLGISVPADTEEVGLGVNNELDEEDDAKLITVTVIDGDNPDGFKFSAYKSNF
ncbi:MAG: type II secretion system GspH family protein [Pseudomonadales bacterium]|nr:type II secretion system GspH family protein [Pseudomonadales bacterium]